MSGEKAPTPQAAKPQGSFVLRPAPVTPPAAIAVASSAGGPEALFKIVPHFKNVPQPVFITQHMPASFTGILAGHIGSLAGRACVEGEDGMAVQPGTIYLAPGDYHMTLVREGARKIIRLMKDPPENFCRPAADPMLRSLAPIYRTGLLAIVLTGMGSDGLKGCEAVVREGGAVLAQDKASSVVWGMPGVVAEAGLCHAVLPLEEIGPYVLDLTRRVTA